jgi:hypothetical protein
MACQIERAGKWQLIFFKIILTSQVIPKCKCWKKFTNVEHESNWLIHFQKWGPTPISLLRNNPNLLPDLFLSNRPVTHAQTRAFEKCLHGRNELGWRIHDFLFFFADGRKSAGSRLFDWRRINSVRLLYTHTISFVWPCLKRCDNFGLNWMKRNTRVRRTCKAWRRQKRFVFLFGLSIHKMVVYSLSCFSWRVAFQPKETTVLQNISNQIAPYDRGGWGREVVWSRLQREKRFSNLFKIM